jgi:prepilin-type N-terminal cleavage/methylation domain-containing protein/prepilin-type processing-associated H-X9-DG protein
VSTPSTITTVIDITAEHPINRRCPQATHQTSLGDLPSGVRRGFTLVELLVVIGVIALLVGILLPVLGRARESANRAVCLSNLRQTHQALLLYAQAHRDQVPLGYRRGGKQSNSQVYSGGVTRRFVLFGLIHEAGLTPDGRVLFCPSENNPRFDFNTPENPWPPGSNPAANTSAGYAMRPEIDIPDNPATVPGFQFPRLSDFRGRAVFSDLTSAGVRVDTRHRSGLNVAYADGSARWIARSMLEPAISSLPEPVFPPDPQWNDEVDTIWQAFDRQ